jgi:transposase
MVIIGIDPHSTTHVAAAVDEHGQLLGSIQVGASPQQLQGLAGWVGGFQGPRLVAVEGARGYGLALTRVLLAAGERVVDVAPALTAAGRRRGRARGKDDRIDAIAVARLARQEPGLPALSLVGLNADLKLLVDARDQLVVEAGRVRNRLHALLLVLAPGYRTSTGALAKRPALRRARRLIERAAPGEAVRARLALAAVARLEALEDECGQLEHEVKAALTPLRPTRLLAICGVGALTAAKLLGETHSVDRFASAAAFAAHTGTAPIPVSSGNTQRHRLSRSGNRQLNRALFTIAMCQARWDPNARAYLARKRSEGKSPAEARRCLKRHLANVVYRAMVADAQALQATPTPTA